MPKPILSDSFRKLENFFKNYSFKKLVKNQAFIEKLKKIHKKFHSLLIYHNHLNSSPLWPKESQRSQEFSDYLNESVSDLSQSIFCFSHGSYKASFLLLRSAIENLIKTIGIHQNQKVLTITAVHDLIELVSKTDVVSKTPLIKKHYDDLRVSYGLLCKYVHTANPNYMTRTTIVGIHPYFDDNKGQDTAKLIYETADDILAILSCMFWDGLRKKLHHTELDIINDSICNEVKSFIAR